MADDSFKSSLLDRLTGPAESAPNRSLLKAVATLKQEILRDLVELLNTRARCTTWPEQYGELNQTLLDYGVPDFAGRDFATDADREFLRHSVCDAIARYEPRLRNVLVELGDNDDILNGRVRIEIVGGLSIAPDDLMSFGVDLIERSCEFQAEAG